MRKIFNFQIKNSKGGFTLIELVVVIGVISLIGVSVVAILVSTLRNVNKTNVVSLVRQNGDYALSQIAKNIRTALDIQYPVLPCAASNPTALDHIQFTSLTGTAMTYTCSGTTITGSNGSLIDTTSVQVVPGSCNFYCTQSAPSENPVIKIIFSLTDTDVSNLVERSAAPIQFQTSINLRNIIQ